MNNTKKTEMTVFVPDDFITFTDFKKGETVDMKSAELLSRFQSKLYAPERPPIYSVIPQNNTFFGEHKTKYMVLDVNDDRVLLQYRIIQIFQNKIIKVLDAPISQKGDENSVKAVIEWLSRFDFVKFVYPEYLLDLYGEGKEVENYNNFYFDVEGTYKRFSEHKWMKDSKMNSFIKESGFRCEYLKGCDCAAYKEDITGLIDKWCEDSKHNVDSGKYIEKMFGCGDDFVFIAAFYKDTMLSIEPLIVQDGYAFSIGFFHIGRRRDGFADNPKLKTVCGHLSDISEYHIIKYLKEKNCKRFYVEGSRLGNTKSLYNHKLKRYDGYVKYYEK